MTADWGQEPVDGSNDTVSIKPVPEIAEGGAVRTETGKSEKRKSKILYDRKLLKNFFLI